MSDFIARAIYIYIHTYKGYLTYPYYYYNNNNNYYYYYYYY